jgi:hypothetical protein
MCAKEDDPSMHDKCICGTETDDHVGDCHFGYHNPETCPLVHFERDKKNAGVQA